MGTMRQIIALPFPFFSLFFFYIHPRRFMLTEKIKEVGTAGPDLFSPFSSLPLLLRIGPEVLDGSGSELKSVFGSSFFFFFFFFFSLQPRHRAGVRCVSVKDLPQPFLLFGSLVPPRRLPPHAGRE